MNSWDEQRMPDDPMQEWDIVTYEIDGYEVRLSWLQLAPRFQILGTDLPLFSSTFDVRSAIDQLIQGEAMQMTTTPPATDALKARADFLATHLTAIAHLQEIERRREVECI
jgi:hypothetical protein